MDKDTFTLIDGLLTYSKDNRQTAIKVMDNGEMGGDIKTASEIVGHRFGIRPGIIIEWYNERKTRLL